MKKNLLCFLLIISMLIPCFSAAGEDYTSLLLEKGIISGDENGLRENDYVSRAEFVKMINRTFNISTDNVKSSKTAYSDIHPLDWFYRDFVAAVEEEYIKGDEKGRLNPHSYISRQEAATILGRLIGSYDAKETTFNDNAKIEAWAKGSVCALNEEKIISGDEKGFFNPDKNLTRYECFVMLTRLFKGENVEKIQIDSPFSLYLFNLYPTKNFELTKNIDLLGKTLPLPLCKDGFSGTFNGNNFRISNITTKSNDYVLFNKISSNGIVRKVILVCPLYFAGLAKTNDGLIEFCGQNSFKEDGINFQSVEIGGAFASENNGTIRYSYTTSFLKGRHENIVAGICGINNGTVDGCFSVSSGNDNAYGIVAINNSSLKNSYTHGNLSPYSENYGTVFKIYRTSEHAVNGMYSEVALLKKIYSDYPYKTVLPYKFPIIEDVLFSMGETIGEFETGSGTKDDPFVVSSPIHFKNVRNHPDKYFVQACNIDLSGVYDFIPFGDKNSPFIGEYNGNGFEITNLKIFSPEIQYPSLFGINRGKISNVHLTNVYIKGVEGASSLIYENHGICENSSFSGVVEGKNTGGIVYKGADTSFVSNCTFTGLLKGNAGGGIVFENRGNIQNCLFAGEINSISGGGISYVSYKNIATCLSKGNINSQNKDGLVLSNTGNVENCYSFTDTAIDKNLIRQPMQGEFPESFKGFDFKDTWVIYNDAEFSFPILLSSKNIIKPQENKEAFAGGNGTVENPFRIVTPLNFKNIINYPKASFVLMNDIDLTYLPGKIESFSGTLDGNGFAIYGLKENGLFEKNSGTIKNLTIISESLTLDVGGPVCNINNGIIYNCHTNSNIYISTGGGICNTNNGLVEMCSINKSITVSTLGGGISATNNAIIKNCLVGGNVIGENDLSSIYGISKNESGKIIKCFVVSDLYFIKGIGEFFPVSNTYENSYFLNRYGLKEKGALTFSQITNKEYFNDFDFNNLWSVSSLNIPVLKSKEKENYKIPATFKGGDGSKENPFAISTPDDFYNIRMYPESYFTILNDINFLGENSKCSLTNNGMMGFSPINSFSGEIEGNNHSILGVKILYSNRENAGIFSENKGVVKNLTFLEGIVEGMTNAGFVCGINYGEISGISVAISRIGSASLNAGGICGINNGIISSCVNRSDIFSASATGGICGENNKKIVDCANYGGIVSNSSDFDSFSGGICGKNNGLINTSMNLGKIISYSDLKTASSGGICGINADEIFNCYNTGTISSKSTQTSFSGGICGNTEYNSYISFTYNIGYSTSESPMAYVGALAGNAKGSFLNSYYDNTLSDDFGINSLTRETVLPLSPDRMVDINFFTGFNTKSIWTKKANYDYPQLIGNPHIIFPLSENIRDFAGGDGSLENPYRILTPGQLDNVRKYLGSAFTLLGNIDMSNYCRLNDFKPIGDNIFAFFGIFNGNGYTISGINQENNYYGGLFLQNMGEIHNLITSDFKIDAVLSGNIAAINTGLIYRCCNTSDIQGNKKDVLTGGVAGLNKSSGMIIYSSNIGTVSALGESSQAGGITYGNYGIIAGCFNSGPQVFSEGTKLSMAGGIASFNYNTISDCYNNADIYSNDISGGITATNTGNIINSYVTSNYIFGKIYGGITANGNNSTIINAYYPKDRISKGIENGKSDGIIGVNSNDMLKQETFEGFDFENMWLWAEGYCPLISEALL